MDGYMGRLLVVDLSAGACRDEPLNADYARQYLGGSGLGARYLYDLLDPATDPLGPANPLLFMTGPLVGTAAPSCGRFEVCARSPSTNLWGEGNSGGFWGPELKAAGYDGIIVQGAASAPAYLSIADGKAELADAGELWGLDFYATQTALRARLGEKTKIAAIGPAGEKLARFAVVMNDHGRCAGRGGMGAVMGSKKLKAIAVRGSHKAPLADRAAFSTAAQAALAVVREDLAPQMLGLGGTAFYTEMGMLEGDVPSRYWTGGFFDGAEKLSGGVMADTIDRRRL